ncbi:uncharacterized protein LOC134356749 isoform X2 [Mobula hypostoma]|uniref:uncharacterized protein LOC134356749 isoform X2 n=1 Tax=Mobula hypostoma TaxID=723540 RepID=UPI002FC33473
MGGSSSKGRSFWPFGSGAVTDTADGERQQSLARYRSGRLGATPFVFSRRRWIGTQKFARCHTLLFIFLLIAALMNSHWRPYEPVVNWEGK